MLNLRMAGILSLIQLACTLIVTLLYARVNSKRATALKPGKGVEPRKPVGMTQTAICRVEYPVFDPAVLRTNTLLGDPFIPFV